MFKKGPAECLVQQQTGAGTITSTPDLPGHASLLSGCHEDGVSWRIAIFGVLRGGRWDPVGRGFVCPEPTIGKDAQQQHIHPRQARCCFCLLRLT
jgi:hypothetical protein